MTQQNNVPNLYQVAGGGISIIYAVDNGNGESELTYQDGSTDLTFTGTEVSKADCALGTLVTVFLKRSIDAGSTTLNLVIPGVNLAATLQQNINTFAVVTNNLFSILQLHVARQTQVYSVYQLTGTASA